jgi:hypothetical protein
VAIKRLAVATACGAIAALFVVVALAAAQQADGISRHSVGGVSIGATLASTRALWGSLTASFASKRGTSYVWYRPDDATVLQARFARDHASWVSAHLSGGARLTTTFGDGFGTALRTIRAHFPGGIARRTCCWRGSYAVAARPAGYMLAFTFNAGGGLEAVDVVDRRSYLTCFGTRACD